MLQPKNRKEKIQMINSLISGKISVSDLADEVTHSVVYEDSANGGGKMAFIKFENKAKDLTILIPLNNRP